jgi:CBS domain-containing protein
MLVRDTISEKILTVSPDDTISKIIPLIEKDKLREIIITDKGKFKGVVYSKDITNRDFKDPSKTKISSIIRASLPTVPADEDISKAAEIIFKTGLRSLPVVENEKVIGIVSICDVVDFASKMKEFKQTTAEAIMSYPEVIKPDTDIGKARLLMRERNVSRLPVVDDKNELVGIVTIFDLLKAVKPAERMDFFSMSAEKEKTLEIPISTIIDSSPSTSDRGKTLSEIVGLMRRNNTDGILIVENKVPVGIVTEKDLLEVYVSSLNKKGVYYQISGLNNEDEFVVSTVDRMVRDSLQKLSKMITPQSFFLHIKKYGKSGKIKYSIRTRFRTDANTFASKSFAWDLRDAVNSSLDNLERIIIKSVETKRDKTRTRQSLKR